MHVVKTNIMTFLFLIKKDHGFIYTLQSSIILILKELYWGIMDIKK